MQQQKKYWILPVAGNGKRTQSLGKYKPFIEIKGKKIIEWFLLSIFDKINSEDIFIIVTTEQFEKEHQVSKTLYELFDRMKLNNEVHIVCAPKTPQGPAKSTEWGLMKIDNNNLPIIIANSDQYILFNLPSQIKNSCYLVSNIDTGNSKSYIELKSMEVSGIKEKHNETNIASSGIYIYPNKVLLNDSLKQIFENKLLVKNEYYISSAMDYLIGKVRFELIPTIAKFDLGTVESIKYFENHIETLCNKLRVYNR